MEITRPLMEITRPMKAVFGGLAGAAVLAAAACGGFGPTTPTPSTATPYTYIFNGTLNPGSSLLFTPVLPRSPVRVLDIGAGAGIPGVPLRVVDPGLSLSLIESRRKPVSFLHALLRELALPDITVYHGRAETIVSEVPDLQNRFDIVLARAVGLGALLVETALAYLRSGGRLIAAGPPAGRALPALCGVESAEWKTIEFPKLGIARSFLIVTNGD